jgi:tripartite-type tricarboxylate transporter receptor subunit TctC
MADAKHHQTTCIPAAANAFRAAVVAVGCALAGGAFAQSYPVKPVRLVIGYVPGGATDVIGRLVAQRLTEFFGQAVIVENRPGAGSTIAAERVATSPPDGHALLLGAASTAVQSGLRSNLPYDYERDFAHISLVAVGPFVLVVHPSVPARDTKELIALARSRPGKLNYGTPGVGTINHLAGELFKLEAGIDMVHVAYKGASESTVANASGEIAISFPSVPAALPLLKPNKIRALAVTGTKRVSVLPDVPTIDESALPGFDYAGALGISAPAATPKEIVVRLNAALVKVVNTPEMKEAINRHGFEPQTSTSEEYAKRIHEDIAKVVKLVKATGVKFE